MTRFIFAALFLVLPFAAISAEAMLPYAITNAFVRATPAKISAGYMTIDNPTETDDALSAVVAPWAERAELHAVEKDEKGVLSMKPVRELKLPAKSTLKLENGGYHIMFYGVKAPLAENTDVPVTLYFKSGMEKTLSVPVKPITYTP